MTCPPSVFFGKRERKKKKKGFHFCCGLLYYKGNSIICFNIPFTIMAPCDALKIPARIIVVRTNSRSSKSRSNLAQVMCK